MLSAGLELFRGEDCRGLVQENEVADITVRKMTFEFPEDRPALRDLNDVRGSGELAGFPFTMPYLEPYLIHTMRVAVKQATDPAIADDIRKFSAREGNHFRNQAHINNVLSARLAPETPPQIKRIEADMDVDYQRFTKSKSLKFNLTYARASRPALVCVSFRPMCWAGFHGSRSRHLQK